MNFATSTKSVEFAYPTSVTACRFGYGGTGCWTIQLQSPEAKPVSLKAFMDRGEAVREASGMPQKWNSMFRRLNPQDCK